MALGGGVLAAAATPARQPTTLAEAIAMMPEPTGVVKVGDNLWQVPGVLGSNVTVLVTDEGLVLVDSKYSEQYDSLMKVIREKISTRPVKYVINSHFHAYGSGGGTRLRPAGADILSSIKARQNTVDRVQPNAPPDLVPANLAFEGEMRLFVGKEEVRIKTLGPGHTNADVTVYFPRQRVLCVGDLIAVFPDAKAAAAQPPGPIDYNGGGRIDGWIANLETMAADPGYDKIIAGHGPVGGRQDVLVYRAQLVQLREQISEFLRDGTKTEADLKLYLAKDLHWSDLPIARGAHGLYQDLRP